MIYSLQSNIYNYWTQSTLMSKKNAFYLIFSFRINVWGYDNANVSVLLGKWMSAYAVCAWVCPSFSNILVSATLTTVLDHLKSLMHSSLMIHIDEVI